VVETKLRLARFVVLATLLMVSGLSEYDTPSHCSHRRVGLHGCWKFIFPDEDWGSKLLQYVGNHLINNTASYPRRLEHTYRKSSTVYITYHICTYNLMYSSDPTKDTWH